MSSSVKIQFVWVPTDGPLKIPTNRYDIDVRNQLQYNYERLVTTFQGQLSPTLDLNETLIDSEKSVNCDNVQFELVDPDNRSRLDVTNPVAIIDRPQTSDTSYLTKNFLKITMGSYKLPSNNTDRVDVSLPRERPTSYNDIHDLKVLYAQAHPDFKTKILDKNLNYNNKILSAGYPALKEVIQSSINGKIVVFITNLVDKQGFPMPHLFEDFNREQDVIDNKAIFNCVAISPWTLGDATHPNEWIEANNFNRVPWCKNMMRGGAMSFAVGTVLGLKPSYDSQCNDGSLHKFPNIYVTDYRTKAEGANPKSNTALASKNQLLFLYGDNTHLNIFCPDNGDIDTRAYSIMDMSADTSRYYVSSRDKEVIDVIVKLEEFKNMTGYVAPPEFDVIDFVILGFATLMFLMISCCCFYGFIIAWMMWKDDPSFYYNYISPFGQKGPVANSIFLSPLIHKNEVVKEPPKQISEEEQQKLLPPGPGVPIPSDIKIVNLTKN
jgi:hypothetical protein